MQVACKGWRKQRIKKKSKLSSYLVLYEYNVSNVRGTLQYMFNGGTE